MHAPNSYRIQSCAAQRKIHSSGVIRSSAATLGGPMTFLQNREVEPTHTRRPLLPGRSLSFAVTVDDDEVFCWRSPCCFGFGLYCQFLCSSYIGRCCCQACLCSGLSCGSDVSSTVEWWTDLDDDVPWMMMMRRHGTII
jgi:hypothetical protein